MNRAPHSDQGVAPLAADIPGRPWIDPLRIARADNNPEWHEALLQRVREPRHVDIVELHRADLRRDLIALAVGALAALALVLAVWL